MSFTNYLKPTGFLPEETGTNRTLRCIAVLRKSLRFEKAGGSFLGDEALRPLWRLHR